jgi:uridine kinase
MQALEAVKMSDNRLLEVVTKHIEEKRKVNSTLLVCIDGVDTSGKTTLCRSLADYLTALGYSVIKASIDGFHNPPEKRYTLGSKSPEGYYRHSFDYDSLVNYLIKPLKEGSLEYKTAVYDFKTESKIEQEPKKAAKDTILLMEGVFLLRPELIGYWDYSIFLHVDFEQVISRAKIRDQYLFGSEEEIESRYRSKYIPGQQIYLRESNAHSNANIVIDNNDYLNPRIVRNQSEIDELRRRAFDFI